MFADDKYFSTVFPSQYDVAPISRSLLSNGCISPSLFRITSSVMYAEDRRKTFLYLHSFLTSRPSRKVSAWADTDRSVVHVEKMSDMKVQVRIRTLYQVFQCLNIYAVLILKYLIYIIQVFECLCIIFMYIQYIVQEIYIQYLFMLLINN